MYAIRNYTNTKCELEMAMTRLRLLIDRKEQLYCKYFPVTAKIKEVVVDGKSESNNKMADYLHELHEIDIGTGKSLAEEIEYEQQNVDKLQNYLNDMTDILSKMTGTEYQLFYEIVFKGVSITKAVDNIANNNLKKGIKPCDVSTIWKNHYRKIKKYINKINQFST